MAITTYDSLITFFKEIMDDDSFGDDFLYDLFAQADIELALERPWEALTVYGQTFSYSSGDTYLTAYSFNAYSPALLYFRAINLDRSEAENREQANMSDRYKLQNQKKYFFVDWRNTNFYLGGNRNQSGTGYVDYVMTPTYAASGGTPPWPQPFRHVVAYRAAAILKGAVDADSISRVLTKGQFEAYQRLMDRMQMWDGRLKSQGQNTSVGSTGDRADYPQQILLGR